MQSWPVAVVAVLSSVVFAGTASSQGQSPGGDDVYHVSFSKAVPGQAVALGKALSQPDPAMPMPDHFVVLRHREGDDWDYVVIQHMGPTATVSAKTGGPGPGAKLTAWHNDTFVTGPSWGEFTKALGLGGGAASAVYTVAVHRPVPGHREELRTALSAPAPGKVQTGDVILQHVQGSEWSFLTITRYDSWQDFATDRAAAAAADASGWGDVRQHSAFHRDTIADRIHPR